MPNPDNKTTRLLHTTGRLIEGIWFKASALWRSARLTRRIHLVPWNPGAVQHIISSWKEDRAQRRNTADEAVTLNAEDQELCEKIRKLTAVWNRNNVTRTQAYWNVYEMYPELHWALLAHLVSRNGGWSMTDLKGEWLPKLLSAETAEQHFHVLEMCNALIFRDAYPQLQLYAQSKRTGASLFHLLPQFGVSSFMDPIWHRFWNAQDSALLTVALIVNEQHVIQQPVVENRYFQEAVFESLAFRSQPLMQTNQVLFPLLYGKSSGSGHRIPLAGRVLERFVDLDERIEFGKCLYGMLFGYSKVLTDASAFAREVPHTGSRADYWPEHYHAHKTKTGGKPRKQELSADQPWYSPTLESAWPDQPQPAVTPHDWFTDLTALSYLTPPTPPLVVDITYEHLLCQRKLQAASELLPD